MTFNSFPFLIFAIVFYSLWPYARQRQSWRWFFLVVFSFFFYGWFDWRYLGLLLASGVVDFYAALAMKRYPERRRALLWLSMSANLGLLAAFKYITFFTTNLNELSRLLGGDALVPVLYVFPPAGISFYTFQSMSYTIDVYKGKLAPTDSLLKFFAFLSLFPQLVAGPIVRATELMDQLDGVPSPTERQQWEGLRLLVHGYFKKAVLADNLAPAVEHAAGALHFIDSTPFWWLAALMLGIQIYCDFAGYSDIARGLGKWMGYEFPVNFDHPYLATSLRGFWMRWNMTVTRWFRDYVYLGLKGSRTSLWRSARNLWITVILLGFWHGANWTFVIFGTLQAILLTIERVTHLPRRLAKIPFLGRGICVVLVALQMMLTGVFFRAPSVEHALLALQAMLSFKSFDTAPIGSLFFAIPFLIVAILWEVLVFCGADIKTLERSPRFVRLEPLLLILMIVCSVYLRGLGTAFVYFQF
ncbi:MAG: MBOAT family protein [Candidatus Wallbacteria bacterium]|nr:MBOAT family protein [Candidatus Wallbacteria bacterium]